MIGIIILLLYYTIIYYIFTKNIYYKYLLKIFTMLFYGKELDFTYIILIVILISAMYILYSFYQQQKESIQVISSSQPIVQLKTVAIPNNVALSNGAFAMSLWVNLNSSPQFIVNSASNLNLVRLTNTNSTKIPTVPVTLLSLTLDNNGNLGINSSNQNTSIMLFPIGEPVNIVLNYNGDDDIDVDKNESETVYDSTTNKNIPIYNPDSNTFYNGSKRALDVYVNGFLNNTVIIDTLTNSTSNANSPYVTYLDASMNYVTTNGNQVVIGDNQITAITLDGTISNVTFIKNGCSPQDVRTIFNQGNSGSILENLLSYKLRFSLLEDNKEVKTYDVL